MFLGYRKSPLAQTMTIGHLNAKSLSKSNQMWFVILVSPGLPLVVILLTVIFGLFMKWARSGITVIVGEWYTTQTIYIQINSARWGLSEIYLIMPTLPPNGTFISLYMCVCVSGVGGCAVGITVDHIGDYSVFSCTGTGGWCLGSVVNQKECFKGHMTIITAVK